MSFELWMLFGAGVWGLVHISAASFSYKAQVGNAYTVGARDTPIAPERLAGRLARAQRNFQETFAIFAVFVLLVTLTGAAGWLSQWGSALYFAGRVVYLPLYAAGLPWLRSICWDLATLGLAAVAVQLVI